MFIHFLLRYNMEVLPAMFLCAYFLLWAESLWKISIHCSTFKYSLEDSVEYIYRTMFESTWAILIISIWWYLDFFIISHFLPRLPYKIHSHEVPLIFFLVKIGNIFIIHHKIQIFYITFWTLNPHQYHFHCLWYLQLVPFNN